MKRESTVDKSLKFALVLGIVLFLCSLILQMDRMEERLIRLASHNEELKGQVSRVQVAQRDFEKELKKGAYSLGGGTGKASSGREWLHPEVDNFLDGEPPDAAPEDAPMNGVLHKVYGFQGVDPKGLNFLIENAAGVSEEIREYVNPTLASRSPKDPTRFYGILAERIEITDDYREYTIYLKDDLKWHRPAVDWANPRYDWLDREHKVTAHDFKYTLDLILNPQVQASHLANYYQDIEEVEVIDDQTLVIRWKKKTYQSVSFTLGLWPTPEWLYGYDEDGNAYPSETAGLKFNEHWYNNRAIGCGPYEFVQWDQGVVIQLKRNDEWVGDLPPIKEINYLMIQDRNQQLLKFQSGVLDMHELPVSQYREKILDSPAESPYRNGMYDIHTVNEMVYRYIGWNGDHYLFSDKRVRQAMAHAMNRKAIIKNVLYDLATLTTGPFFRFSPAYDTSVEPIPYDLKRASELLDEAGWRDTDGDGIRDKVINGQKRDFEFPLLVYGHRPEVKSWSTIFKEDLYRIGVVCKLVSTEWSVMLKKMEERDFIAYTGGWGLDFGGDPYQIWHSSQADLPKSSNRVGFRNPEADVIIEKLRETFDPQKRVELQHQFHRILREEQPYLFMYSEKTVFASQPRLQNVEFQPFRPHVQSLNWYIEKESSED